MGFTGQEEDHEIGVIDMRARLYDPFLGRFLNADPHVTNPLSAQSWNSYSYVRNRPTVFIDPTGMDDVSIGGWSFTLPSTGIGVVDSLVAQAANGVGAVIDYVAGDGSVPVQKVAAAEDVAAEVAAHPGGVNERAANAQLAGVFFQEGVGDALHDMGFGAVRTIAQSAAPTTASMLGLGTGFAPHAAPELTGNAWADQALNIVPITRIAGGFFRTGLALGSGDPYAAGYTVTSPAIEVALLAAGLGASEGGVRPAPMNGVTESGATIWYGRTATAIGNDANTLQNFARSQGAAGHDLIVHGAVVDGQAQFMVNGMATHPQQIADALLGNPAYRAGTPVQLVTCFGACGLSQELEAILGVRVGALPVPVDLNSATGLLRPQVR